jgi:hypothetical protein
MRLNSSAVGASLFPEFFAAPLGIHASAEYMVGRQAGLPCTAKRPA